MPRLFSIVRPLTLLQEARDLKILKHSKSWLIDTDKTINT